MRARPRPTSVGRGTLCCAEGLSYSGVLPRLTAIAPARTHGSTPPDARSGSGDGPSSKGPSARMPDRIVAVDAVFHDMPHVRADSDIRDPASRKALVPVSR